jgi:integrase
MDPSTVAVLVQRRLDQNEERRQWGAGWQDTGLVFTREDGSVLRPESVSRHFRSLTRAEGLPPIRFHDLRHTSASLALAAGVAMKVVSDRLGHSTTGITADLYTHVSPVVARDAAAAIAALVEASAARNVGEMLASKRPAITSGRLTNAKPQVSGGRGIRTHEEDRSS